MFSESERWRVGARKLVDSVNAWTVRSPAARLWCLTVATSWTPQHAARGWCGLSSRVSSKTDMAVLLCCTTDGNELPRHGKVAIMDGRTA